MKECPSCGGESEKSYRCTECGTDLAGRGTEGREDIVTDGGYDYHVRISAPNRPDAFAQLIHSLDVDDKVVWNGRSEPFTVTGIEREEGEPNGIVRFERSLILENQTRENGAEFRLNFKEGSDGDQTPFSVALDARCTVQRQIGERGNDNGWGRCTDVGSLAHVNPVESAQRDGDRAVADGGTDLEELPTDILVGKALEYLNDQEPRKGIPTDDVVDWIVARTDRDRSEIEKSIEWLHSHGHVYEPSKTHLRRTDPEDSRWSR